MRSKHGNFMILHKMTADKINVHIMTVSQMTIDITNVDKNIDKMTTD
jgi:hypothetical protein